MTEVEYSAFPTSGQVEAELNRVKYKNRYHSVLRSTVFTLLVVAAIAVLIATLWMPVLRIYGESMSPTLTDGSIVVTLKTSSFKEGSIVAFYYNNKVLVKRVIAGPGDWVDIDEDGNVYVNNVFLEASLSGTGWQVLRDGRQPGCLGGLQKHRRRLCLRGAADRKARVDGMAVHKFREDPLRQETKTARNSGPIRLRNNEGQSTGSRVQRKTKPLHSEAIEC